MEKLKYTEGKWSVDGYNLTAVISEQHNGNHSTYKHICDCNYGHTEPLKYLEENKANALLISHAPEMLEVLQAVQASKSYNKTDLALMYNLVDQTLKKIIG